MSCQTLAPEPFYMSPSPFRVVLVTYLYAFSEYVWERKKGLRYDMSGGQGVSRRSL